jgi:hypothetical protein
MVKNRKKAVVRKKSTPLTDAYREELKDTKEEQREPSAEIKERELLNKGQAALIAANLRSKFVHEGHEEVYREIMEYNKAHALYLVAKIANGFPSTGFHAIRGNFLKMFVDRGVE